MLENRLPLLTASAMAAAALATSAATSQWWVLPIGLLAGGLFWALSDRGGGEIPRELDPAHRARAQRLLTTRDRLLEEIASTPPLIRDGLSAAAERIRELSRKCLSLLSRHQELTSHAARIDERALQAERQRLLAMAHSARGAVARERYLQAVAASEGQLEARADLLEGQGQLDAEVAAIQASLEGLATRLVQMKSAQARAALEGEAGRLARTLGEVTSEVEAIADSVEAVVAGRGRRTPERIR